MTPNEHLATRFGIPSWPEQFIKLFPLPFGLVLFIGATVVQPVRAFAQPPISITACGKITKAGLYEVDSNLIVSVPSVDCVVITAPNVSLNLNRYTIYGATDAVGIHVMKGGTRAFIEGSGATIQSFGEGIQIDAPGVLVDNVIAYKNTDAGILLNHVQQADLSNFTADANINDGVRIIGGGYNVLQMPTVRNNGRFGVWIESSSHNSVGNFAAQSNSIAGIYVGCSTVGPQGLCPRGAHTSDYNYLFSGFAGILGGTQNYGIAIDRGDGYNRVVNIAAHENNQLDFFDVNADCGTDYWFAETEYNQVEPASCIN